MLAALLGFAIGYIGSMPVAGPIAVLVVAGGLDNRSRNALFLASGSAVAESVYAYLAFWGFSAVLTRYRWVEPTARVATAVLLIGLGAHFCTKRADPAAARPVSRGVGNKRSFFLGFTITALNPTLLATWTAAVTTLYSLQIVRFDAARALPFSLGAFSGIVSWFTTLLFLLDRFRARLSSGALERVLRTMGAVLIAGGLGLSGWLLYRVWS